VGSNIQAAKGAMKKAEELGYNSMILSTVVSGETRDAAAAHAAIARNILMTDNPIKRPACVISGGETTVSIQGDGLGGRNQEFVLAAAMNIDGLENTAILSCGTDGTDGPTDAAGAFADGKTIRRARMLDLDAGQFLLNNDSYHFFQPLNDLIITGPTYTNVMDLHILIVQ
jgi:hydroxypyruvate reductase